MRSILSFLSLRSLFGLRSSLTAWMAIVALAACADGPVPTAPVDESFAPGFTAGVIDPGTICPGGTMPEAECEALVSIFNETDGLNWNQNTNWGVLPNPCLWARVTCEFGLAGSVTELDLGYNNLEASGFPSAFGAFPSLVLLDLSFASLPGPIPAVIGNLSNLEVLNLEGAALEGALPTEIGNLTSLRELDLSQNPDLVGSLPTSIGNLTDLRKLRIFLTGLGGSLPSSLGNLVALEELNLESNAFTGPLPSELGNLTSLVTMAISRNAFTGPIPASLGNLTSLERMGMAWNDLSGPLPATLGNLTSLEALTLTYNEISGPLPLEMAGMTALERLDLSGNPLGGELPNWLGDLPAIEELRFDDSQLVGAIPASLGNAGTQLGVLVLSDNDLTGNVPEELGQLTGLTTFALSHNPLSGPLPFAVAALEGAIGSCVMHDTDLYVPDHPDYRALDTDGNEMICSVPFLGAEDIGDDTAADIWDLVPGTLNHGQANALTKKIENAIAKADQGKYHVAITMMEAFIGQVESMVSNGALTQEEAQPFLDQAEAMILIWSALV